MKSLRFAYFALLLTFINMPYQFPNVPDIDQQSNEKVEQDKEADKKNLKRFIKPFLIISGGAVLTFIGYKLYKSHNLKPITLPSNPLPISKSNLNTPSKPKEKIKSLEDKMQSLNTSLFKSTQTAEKEITTTIKDKEEYHKAVINHLKEYFFDRDINETEDPDNYPDEVILDDGNYTSKFRVPRPIYQEVKAILDKERKEVENITYLQDEAKRLGGYDTNLIDIVFTETIPLAHKKRINNDSIKHTVVGKDGNQYAIVESIKNDYDRDSVFIVPKANLTNIQNSPSTTNAPAITNDPAISNAKPEEEPTPTSQDDIKSKVIKTNSFGLVQTFEEFLQRRDTNLEAGTPEYEKKEFERIKEMLEPNSPYKEIECPYNSEFCAFQTSSALSGKTIIIGPKKSRFEEIKNELKSAKEKKEFADCLLAHAKKNCNSSNHSCMTLVENTDHITNILSHSPSQTECQTDDGVRYTIFTLINPENNFENSFVVLDKDLPM